jgi:hypothetical protein
MDIRKVSNGVISGYQTKESKKEESKKPALGVGSAVSSFEDLKVNSPKSNGVNSSTTEQKGSKDLGLEESVLAGNVDITKQPGQSTESTDGRSRYENSKNYNPITGSTDSGKGSGQDRIDERNAGAVDRSGPSGPDYSSIVNQVLTGDVSLSNDKYSDYQKGNSMSDLRNGASGQLLMDDAAKAGHENKSGYGKEGIQQDGGAGYKNIGGYDNSEGVKGGSDNAAKNNPGLTEAVKQTYIYGGTGSPREYMLKASEDGFNPNDYTKSDGTRVQTGKDGTVVETAKDGTKTVTKPDGSSTTTRPDGSYEDKDKDGKTTEKGGSLTQPVDDEGSVSPEEAGLIGWEKLSPGAKAPRNGSQGGDVDPSEDAMPKGTVVDNTYLERIRLRNNVGQPLDPESGHMGGGRPIGGGSPSTGGDIDMGPDSPNNGYNGPTRGGDPADLNINVGGSPLLPMEDRKQSSQSEDEDKKKTKSKRPYIVYG